MTEARRGPTAPLAQSRRDPDMERLLEEFVSSFGAEIAYAVDEISLLISRERIAEACAFAKVDAELNFDYLRCLAVTDYPVHFQVAYMLYSTSKKHKVMLKANAPKEDPWVHSVVGVWSGADWHEREGAELFGVDFRGHPNLTHLLLFDEFDGKYPLRKDYPFEEVEEWTPEIEGRWKAQS